MKNIAVAGVHTVTLAHPTDYPRVPVTTPAPAAQSGPPRLEKGHREFGPGGSGGGPSGPPRVEKKPPPKFSPGGPGSKGPPMVHHPREKKPPHDRDKHPPHDRDKHPKTKPPPSSEPPWLTSLIGALEGQSGLAGDFGGSQGSAPVVVPPSPGAGSSGSPNIAIIVGGMTLLGVLAWVVYQWYEKHHKAHATK